MSGAQILGISRGVRANTVHIGIVGYRHWSVNHTAVRTGSYWITINDWGASVTCHLYHRTDTALTDNAAVVDYMDVRTADSVISITSANILTSLNS